MEGNITYTNTSYDYSTNEVSLREVIKFVNETFNRNNYFLIKGDDKFIYLCWRFNGSEFTKIEIDKIEQIIKYNKEVHNGRF